MEINRRGLLVRTGLTFAAGALAAVGAGGEGRATQAGTPLAQVDDWAGIRGLFSVSPDFLHFGGLYLASHPAPVQQAIEAHRRGLDDNPVDYLHQQAPRLEAAVLHAAAGYLGADPTDIALTDSTTMGLGVLYTGLVLRPDQDLLTTQHDFYATHEALRLASQRSGAPMRQIALYQRIETVSEDEIVDAVTQGISDQTRVLAVTWVHSSTGLKLPIRRIADVVANVNQAREPGDRVLLCVDGVHGFGVEDTRVADLGCDFFVAGCHKWLLGPRGTGLIWGRGNLAWSAIRPTIPTFGDGQSAGSLNTPGGFHSFEHRWALSEAFNLHQQIGPTRITERIHALNGALKSGLAGIGNVRVVTPLADGLSAGLVCFQVGGQSAQQVVDQLHARKIIATVTPYSVAYPRLAAGLLNDEAQVEAVLDAVRAIA
ncbi:MAG TPA: aminotransferase class V-fold PLP-dependent enzyme [Chloroflexota bacterium]|nr:aminotransferase class V-fold PLP-dependent enzyme [Chloroflexota bacterium]